jgi:SAM-dependent methyltransferase
MTGPADDAADPAPANLVGDFDPGWLDVREPADHAARSGALAESLRAALARRDGGSGGRGGGTELVLRDLGCGTGSLARWLAPRLPGPQLWVLYDRDPALLALAERRTAGLLAADGSPVRVRTVVADLTALSSDDLAGADAVTASALLDLLTAAEADALARACAEAGCAVLWTLSVTGEVDPAHPRDVAVTAAFDAHQRRAGAGDPLLGPDAPQVVAAALRRHGMAVREADSPWRLSADREPALLTEWLRGRAAAATEQDPATATEVDAWLTHRLAAVAAGRLGALVAHRDLLATPPEVAA